MSLGTNIKKYRKSKGMTQKQLAESIDVTASTITKYETEKLEPNISTLIKISQCLEVSIDNILGNDIDPVSYNRILNSDYLSELTVKYFQYPIDKNKFINLLAKKSLTIEQLSDLADVSLRRIQSIIDDEIPTLISFHLKRICTALNVSENYLILNSNGMDIIDIDFRCLLERYLSSKGLNKCISTKKSDEIMDLIKIIIKYSPKEGE